MKLCEKTVEENMNAMRLNWLSGRYKYDREAATKLV